MGYNNYHNVNENQYGAAPNDKTHIQQELERKYNQILSTLYAFYSDCEGLLSESARINKRRDSELEDAEQQIEALKQSKRAQEVLDGIGRALARLYNTIYSMPDEVAVKPSLVKCIQELNLEFENCGITPIYDPFAHQRQSDSYTLVANRPASDESMVGQTQIDKVGFQIENEATLKAEYIAFVKEMPKQPAPQEPKSPMPDRRTETEETFPFQREHDFVLGSCFVAGVGNCACVQILSDAMRNAFAEMYPPQDWVIVLNFEYSFKGETMIFINPSAKDKKHSMVELHKYMLREENGVLYLHLYPYEKKSFNKSVASDRPEKIALASMKQF